MDNKRCPFYGAEFTETYIDAQDIPTDEYECGTWIDTEDSKRSSDCYRAEIFFFKMLVKAMGGFIRDMNERELLAGQFKQVWKLEDMV